MHLRKRNAALVAQHLLQFAQLCARQGIAFAQVYELLANTPDYMNDLSDGLHPGSQGCARMAQTLLAQECVRAFMCVAQ